MKILAADIGGTHARFTVLELDEGDGRLRARFRERHPSAELAATPGAFRRFLGVVDGHIDAASIAVAGAVSGGEAVLTNLDWHIRRADLTQSLGTERVRLLNDFEAVGYVIPYLEEDDYTVIQHGSADPEGLRALLGAGTGLGQAVVMPAVPGGRGVSVHPTEGGHTTYAPRSELEWELRNHLAERYGHVSWERLLSGAGLAAIYGFLVETGELSEDSATRKAMSLGDPAPIVLERGLDNTDPICARALDIFIEAYGARAGDVALATGATGGLYLAGGIALRLREKLAGGTFLNAFLDKGRMSDWLERVPVRVIAREDAGMSGAAIAVLDVATRNVVTALPDAPEGERRAAR